MMNWRTNTMGCGVKVLDDTYLVCLSPKTSVITSSYAFKYYSVALLLCLKRVSDWLFVEAETVYI
jgi:hypothetical protein